MIYAFERRNTKMEQTIGDGIQIPMTCQLGKQGQHSSFAIGGCIFKVIHQLGIRAASCFMRWTAKNIVPQWLQSAGRQGDVILSRQSGEMSDEAN